MAVRYTGSLVIRVVWNDRYYNASVSRKGRSLWFGVVGAPKSSRIASDSPDAYDAAAHAALSFAHDEGAPVGNYGDWTNHGWAISRKPPTRARSNPANKRAKHPAVKRARKAPKRRTAKR